MDPAQIDEPNREAQDRQPRDRQPRTLSIWTGIALTILLHLIQIPLSFLTSGLSFLFIGLSQLLYMIPVFLWVTVRQKELELSKGLVVGAAITFLLNATCVGIVFSMYS